MAPKLNTLCSMLCALLIGAVALPPGSDEVPPLSKFFEPALYQLHFFLQLTIAGEDANTIAVLPPVEGYANTTSFGQIVVFDGTLTETADPTSQVVGSARGFLTYDSLDPNQIGAEVVWTAILNDASGYGGSTLSFRGFDPVADAQREVSVVGGTGGLRFAKGFAVETYVYQDTQRITERLDVSVVIYG